MKSTTPALPTKRFSLTIGSKVDLLIEATDSGRTWNGFAVPILTEDQASIIGAAIGEPDLQAGESDGLQWEIEHEPTEGYTPAHFNGTANGKAACDGYKRDVSPFEALTDDRSAVTCADCKELMEEPIK